MKTKTHLYLLTLWVLASALSLQPSALLAQGTAFTYQGRLADGGTPAQGIYDFQFTIYDAASGGPAVAGPITNSPVTVSEGLFTTVLDFGSGVFGGNARWLEFGVRTNGGSAFTTLEPRQELTPAPYALFAPSAGAAVTAASAVTASTVTAGGVDNTSLAVDAVTSDKVANGSLTAADLNVATFSNTFWKVDGNAGTTPGTHFLGTTDDKALEFKVNSQRVLRLEPNAESPNSVGGFSGNVVAAGLHGATIGGGGQSGAINSIYAGAHYSVIGGGKQNYIRSLTDNPSDYSTIAGGSGNLVSFGASIATISGGTGNQVLDGADYSTIGGGAVNVISNSAYSSTVAGGRENLIGGSATYASLGGGLRNRVAAAFATVGGGRSNLVAGSESVVAGGFNNRATSTQAAIAGGADNEVGAMFGSIPGGQSNAVTGAYAFAAGRRAKANHIGSFVWADAADADFTSSSDNQFLIRASGGVGIGTTNPTTLLDVNGTVTATAFNGSGGGLTALNASALTTGTLPPSCIAPGTITSDMLAAGSITVTQLAAGSVTSSALADGAVTLDDLLKQQLPPITMTTIPNPSPATNDSFGYALAGAGADRVLIGAYQDDTGAGNSGAAYLFNTNGALLLTLTNPTPFSEDRFGASVAVVGGDRLLIGAYSDNTATADAGAAYLFDTNGTLLVTFTHPAAGNLDWFGYSVDAVGVETVVIGVPYDDPGGLNTGAACIFTTNGTWLATINNPSPTADDVFGFAVAGVGAQMVLVASHNDDTGAANAGSAYLFGTNGALVTTFNNPAPVANDYFGYAIAAVGANKVLIGAYGADTGADGAGVAYLFSTNGTRLNTFTNPFPAAGDSFGISVADLGSDKVLIGAYGDDTGEASAGVAYVFKSDGTLLATLTNPAPAVDDFFGYPVAAVGPDLVLIGANGDDSGATNSGTAYLCFIGQPYYVPGLAGDGVIPGTITAESMAADIGVWRKAGTDISYIGGNVGIGTTSPTNKLHVAGGVSATAFVNTSDRNAKEHFKPISPSAVLAKVVALPIQQWNFKEAPGVPHLGPTAQDFYAAFGLGGSEVTITTLDLDGVALAAIQGLNQKLEAARAENVELKQRLEQLEQLVRHGGNR